MKINNVTVEQQAMLDEMKKHPLFTPIPTSVSNSYQFGWARGLVLYYETLYHGNWYKWLNILGNGEWNVGEPYPQIELSPIGRDEVRKMLKNSFEPIRHRGIGTWEFLNWILYALGLSWAEKPNMDDKSWEHLYQNMDFSLFLKYPSDYLSLFLAENGSSGCLDYFPTPLHMTIMMNKMMELGEEEVLSNTVYEPCLGTGAMILPSKSLNVVGSDLSSLMVRAAAIQAFFYKPSMLYVPRPVLGLHADAKELRINKYFEFKTDSRIFCGNSLLGEFQCPSNIFVEGSEYVDIYFQSLDLEKHDIYKYEAELEQPWETLSREKQIEIVAAMAREIRPDCVLTNPPFNARISKQEKEVFEEIYKRNQVFIASRQKKEQFPLFAQIEEEVEAKFEIVVTNSKERNMDKDQLMFVF